MQSRVIVISGPPGAGKSTTAVTVAVTYAKAVHLHTDDFWDFISSGCIAPYLPESDPQNQTVVRAIAAAAFAFARGGYIVLVDGVVGPWMLDHYRLAARKSPRIGLDYIVLRPSRAVSLARAQQRSAPNALVDESPINALYDQFSDLAEYERHVIDTTEHSPQETEQAVANAIASHDFAVVGDPDEVSIEVHKGILQRTATEPLIGAWKL